MEKSIRGLGSALLLGLIASAPASRGAPGALRGSDGQVTTSASASTPEAQNHTQPTTAPGAGRVARGYEVAAYYFPAYHPAPRMEAFKGPGWTEWSLVKAAAPHFDGHIQPRAYLDAQPHGPKVLTINAWNEWTEGSYLEPDTVNRLGYLEALKAVFPPGECDGTTASQPTSARRGTIIVPNPESKTYSDGRPAAKYRLEAQDQGVVLRHGDGPNQCDVYGAREAIVFKADETYYLHYDGAGPVGWVACLATSHISRFRPCC